jgi:hypothetical protein
MASIMVTIDGNPMHSSWVRVPLPARAKFQDCRINAYPAFLSKAEEQDYIKGINQNLLTPSILFIDLNLEHFATKEDITVPISILLTWSIARLVILYSFIK